MELIENSNWLSFNVYFTADTLIGMLRDIIHYQKWYFMFLKDIIRQFLIANIDEIKYIYFGDYLDKKPVDRIIIDEIDFNTWIEGLEELKKKNSFSNENLDYFQNHIRYLRIRFFINNNDRDLIIENFLRCIKNIDYILGFQLVEYDVIKDIGERFSSGKDKWNNSSEQLERLEKFIEYWNGICRYVLAIITDEYHLDFEEIDVIHIMHLGYHSMGSNLPIQRCQDCGGILYLRSRSQPECHLQCNCRSFRQRLPHL